MQKIGQLLVDLEWRCSNNSSNTASNRSFLFSAIIDLSCFTHNLTGVFNTVANPLTSTRKQTCFRASRPFKAKYFVSTHVKYNKSATGSQQDPFRTISEYELVA